MAVKHQIAPIGPVYFGGTEINRIYLGTTLVYSTPPYPYSTTDIIDGLGGWNGNYTDLGNDKASVTLDNNNTITIIPSKTYVIFHDPIVDAYFKERLGVTSGEVTLAQFRTLNASTAAFTSAHRPENYAEVTEFNEYRFLSGATVPSVGFYGCTALEEIRIPETVTAINGNDGAFRNCTSLVSIDIPSTVTTLGTYVFMGCTSLTTVTGMEGLRTIPSQAFNGCTNLVNIDLSRITSISNSLVFNGCSSLTNVDLSSATLIGIWAFQSSGLSGALSLPSIGTINQGAFQNVKNLTSVDFCHNSVTLGPYVFNGCSSLTEIRNGEGITSLANNCFQNCTSLPSFHFPYSPTTIPDNVFNGCTSLTTVTGISSAVTIGNSAFYNCTSLLPIDFSEFTNLQTIEASAFRYCTGMNGSTLDFSGCSQLTTIAGGAFRNINFSAFNFTGCTSLRSIGGYAFDGSHATVFDLSSCASLTNLGYVPRYVTDLRVPSSLVSLGTGTDADAMRGMAASSLRTLDLSHCTNLTTIGTRVFYGWTRDANRPLITIKLPASVTSLLTSCISGMPSATVFIFLSTTPPTSSSAVQSNTNVTYYVPYSADHSILEAYQTATNWSGAAARIFELDENGDIPS